MSCTDQDHAGHFCKAGNREQFQAVLIPVVDLGYTTPILNPDPSPLVTRNAARDCGDGRRCSWWWITVHARSVQRTGAVNGAPPPAFVPQVFPPLTQAEIQSSDGRTTSLKCRLTLSDSTDRQRTLVVDIGAGFSIPWYGTAVLIEILTYDMRNEPQFPIAKAAPSFAGFTAQAVEDVIVEANVVPTDGSPRNAAQPLTHTQIITHAGGAADLVFPRPAGSSRMAFFTDSAAPATGRFSVSQDPAVLGAQIGQWFRAPAAPGLDNPGSGAPIDVPGPARASILLLALAGVHTTIWEIEP